MKSLGLGTSIVAMVAAAALASVAIAALLAPATGERLRPPHETVVDRIDAALAAPCPAHPPPPLDSSLAPLHVGAVSEIDQPTAMEVDESLGLVIASRDGRIFAQPPGALERQVVLDLSDDTSTIADQGLLEIAIHEDHLLVLRTDLLGATVLTAHRIERAALAERSGIELLRVDQTDQRHNGGGLAVTELGVAYVGIGDGGGQGDPDGSARDRTSPLGSVLRGGIDLDQGRLVPVEGAESLVWASGLRNPHRIWFGHDPGTIWVTDVGENCREELNRLTTDLERPDLGWNLTEGDLAFLSSTPVSSHIEPVFVHDHRGGRCAIIGGDLLPSHFGNDAEVVVADMCSGELFAIGDDARQLPVVVPNIVDVTVGPEGELLVAGFDGVVRAITR